MSNVRPFFGSKKNTHAPRRNVATSGMAISLNGAHLLPHLARWHDVENTLERIVPPTTIFIDFDGVIRHWHDDDAAIERRCRLPAGAIRRAAFSSELLLPAITGVVRDQTWRQSAAIKLQSQYPESLAHEAVEHWSFSPGAVDAQVLAVLSRCKPGLRLVLATNATSRLLNDLHTLGLSSLFAAVANSSEFGVAKPSPDYFTNALLLANVRASESLFIDDSLSNVIAARLAGISSHHFTGCERLAEFLREAEAFS